MRHDSSGGFAAWGNIQCNARDRARKAGAGRNPLDGSAGIQVP